MPSHVESLSTVGVEVSVSRIPGGAKCASCWLASKPLSSKGPAKVSHRKSSNLSSPPNSPNSRQCTSPSLQTNNFLSTHVHFPSHNPGSSHLSLRVFPKRSTTIVRSTPKPSALRASIDKTTTSHITRAVPQRVAPGFESLRSKASYPARTRASVTRTHHSRRRWYSHRKRVFKGRAEDRLLRPFLPAATRFPLLIRPHVRCFCVERTELRGAVEAVELQLPGFCVCVGGVLGGWRV